MKGTSNCFYYLAAMPGGTSWRWLHLSSGEARRSIAFALYWPRQFTTRGRTR